LNLSLTAPKAGTFPVTITSFTPLASWSPYYDINVESTDKPINIAAKSRVVQTTGLDWTNVRLTLSTATPSNGKVAPLFSTWFLRENQVYLTRMAKAPMVMEAEAVMYDFVETSDNALSMSYIIDLPYSIPGNGKAQNIDLTTKTTGAEYKYYCAPKLDGATYLIAEIADWSKLDLLSAPANITYDGTYIGETRIDASSTNEKLTLTLGTDKRVSVVRELEKDFSAKKNIGNNVEQTFAYKISVKNNQNKEIKLILKDQYPISTDKSIVVTPSIAGNEVGVVTWEENLKASETKIYRLSYSVKYPKDKSLNL
jgi:uncharacterized protein (TIGR02231 family)